MPAQGLRLNWRFDLLESQEQIGVLPELHGTRRWPEAMWKD